MEIGEAQKRAWDNKIAKGFNTQDVALEFGLLTAEVGEAFTAWRKRLPDFGEELADVALYLLAVAEMNGIDFDGEIETQNHQELGPRLPARLPRDPGPHRRRTQKLMS